MVQLRQGHMVKVPMHGHALSRDKVRFFVLTDTALEWFEDDSDPSAAPRGRMPLAHSRVERLSSADGTVTANGDSLALVHEAGAPRLVLRGQDLDGWEKALKHGIEQVCARGVEESGELWRVQARAARAEAQVAELQQRFDQSIARISTAEARAARAETMVADLQRRLIEACGPTAAPVEARAAKAEARVVQLEGQLLRLTERQLQLAGASLTAAAADDSAQTPALSITEAAAAEVVESPPETAGSSTPAAEPAAAEPEIRGDSAAAGPGPGYVPLSQLLGPSAQEPARSSRTQEMSAHISSLFGGQSAPKPRAPLSPSAVPSTSTSLPAVADLNLT